MRFRQMLLLAVVTLCTLAATSCTQLEFSPEALMNAPVLTPEQTEIKAALRMHLGLDDNAIQLKYPKEGNYRSAFVMYDLSGDGKDEALVFYSLRNSTDNKAFINVLTETAAGWVSTCNIGGLGSNVETVAFSAMEEKGRENLIVGWGTSGGAERIISVYTYTADELLEREYRGSYTEMLLCDINGDGMDNLLLLRSNEVSQNSSVVLVAPSARGGLKDTARLTLGETITGFGKVQVGTLSGEMQAVFIDALADDEMVTSIVRYQKDEQGKDQLVNVVEALPKEAQATFRRPEPVYCTDINGDGIMEIPRMAELPGYDGAQYNPTFTTLYSTVYGQIGEDGYEPVWYGYVNVAGGYRFAFPEAWQGVVTASQEANKIHFYVYREDLFDTSEELLILMAGSANDKNDTTEYHALETGRGMYYAAIPKTENKELRLTFTQVQERFSILN